MQRSTTYYSIDHIPPGKDAYACEWLQCTRNGQKQASRHALITHCRAHTGERPYICSHPGCAKTFTRSDALSKHVRSVHATKPPPPSPVDWREAIEAGLYQDVDLAEALTRIEKDDPFWLVTDSDLHIATQIREKYPHDTSDPAKTYIPTSPIHPDELPRPLWQVRYIMAKAKLMLLEEENRMRRTQLLELMESC